MADITKIMGGPYRGAKAEAYLEPPEAQLADAMLNRCPLPGDKAKPRLSVMLNANARRKWRRTQFKQSGGTRQAHHLTTHT